MNGHTLSYPATRAEWRYHWLRCCGDFDGNDCSACCLSWQVPAVAFGENSRRALRKSFWKEVLIFFGLTTCAVLVWGIIVDMKCPSSKNDEASDCDPLFVWVPAVVALPILVLGLVYAGLRRAAIREAFGISGSKLGDVLVWLFCCPCALSQETRTIWHNEVKDGMWRGASSMQSAAFKSVPVQQAAIAVEMPQSYGAQYGAYGQYNV